jgi:methionine-gamma-lyase
MSNQNFKLESFCVKESKDNKTTKPHQLPIYATSSFEFENMEEGVDIFTGKREGHSYSRYGNPTVDTVGTKLAKLEAFGSDLDAYGYLTSSGMSAISTVFLSLLKSGDTVLTQGDLYGGTTEMLLKVIQNSGIETVFTDLTDQVEVEKIIAADASIKMIYFETPANPTMRCIDISVMGDLGKKYELITVCDNTFCTPIIQQPLLLGIDFVIHSTTKYLNGHGNSIAGVIIGHDEKYQKQLWTTLKLLGTTCNPWDAWLINNGMKTLPLRMERHCENAMKVAEFLESHGQVTKVNYNGLTSHPYHETAKKQMKRFGGMLSFEMKGSMAEVLQKLNHLTFCVMAPTLGDVDTLVLHPATSSHLNVDKEQRELNGISDGLVRLSVGIEDVSDIIEDLERALDA